MTAEGGRIENSSEKVGASGMTLADLLDASDQNDTDMNELKTFESWLLLSFGRACNRAVSVDDVHAAAAVAPANFSSLASASSTSASSGSSSSPSDSTGAAVPVSVIHRPSPCCSPSYLSRDGAATSREPRKSAGHAVGKVPVASTSQTESVRLSAPDGVVHEADEQLFSGKRTRFSLISACSHIGQELEDDALEYADRTSVAVPVSDKTSSLRSEDRRSADTDLYVLPERRRVCSLDIAESEEIPESSFSCASPASGPVSLSHSLPHSDLDEEEAAAAAATALFSDRHLPVGLQEPPVHQALSSAKREILLPPSPRRQQHETVRRFGVCSSGDRVWRRSHSQEAAVTRTTASAASNRPPTHAVWTQNSRVRSYLLQERGTDFPPQFPRLARSRSATNLNVRSGVDNSKAAAATIIDDEEATSFNPRAICRRISAPSPPAPKLKAVGVATSTEPWLAATSHPMRATAQAQLGLPRSDSVMPTASGSWTVNFASNVPDSSASVGVTEPREEEEEEDDDGVDSVIEEEEEEDGDNDGDVLSDHHSPSVNLSGRVSPSITSGGRVSPLSTVSGGVLRNYPLAAVCVRPSQGGGGGIFSTLNNITSQSSLSSYFATAASFLRRAEEVSDVTEKFGKFDLPHHPRSNEHETWSMVSEAWSTDVLASDTESINRGGASIGGGVGSAGHSSVLPLPSISLSTSATVASSSSATSHHAPFRCGLHSGYQQPSCPTRRLLPTSTGTNASSQPPTSNRLRRRRRRHHHYHHHGNHAHFGGLPESQRPCAGLPNSSRHRHHHHHRNRTLSPTPPVQPSHPFLASPGESLCGLSASDPAPPASHLTMSPATTTPRSVSCNNAVRSDNQQQKHHPPAEDCHDQRQQSIRQLMNGAVSCLNSERHAQLQVEAREAIHPHTGVNMPTTNSDLRIPTRSGSCRKSADHPEASGSREVKDVGRGGPYLSTSRNKPRTSFLLPSDRGPNLNYEDTSSLLSPSVACAAFSVTPNGLSQSVSQFSSANADDSHVSHTAGVFRRLLNCTSRRLLNLLQSEHVPQVISSLQDQQISPLYSMNHSIDTAEDHTMCTFLVALREHAFQLQDASLAWQAHDALLLIRALQCQWPLDRHSVANRLDHIHSSNTYCAGCPVSFRDSSPPPPLSSAARGCGASGRRRRPRRSLNGLPDGVDGATPATQTPQSPLHSSVTAVAGEPSSLALYLAKRVQREARRRENLLAWLEASNVTVSQRRRELEVLHRLVERQLTALRNEALSRLAEEFLAEESVTLAQLRDTVCSELEHLGQTGGRSRGRQTTANDHTTEPHTARILRHLNSFLDNSQPRLLASLSTLPSATATASATSSEVLATIERILMRDLFFLLCTRYPTSLCEAPSADRKFSDMLIQRRKLASSTWLRGLPERYLTLAPFTMAQTELRLINTNYRPVDKLECLRRVLEGISPSYAHSQLPSSPDPRIVSILAYVIIQANPPCFLLNLHFIEHFGARLLRTDPVDMYSRVWRHVKAAVVQLRGGVGPS
uniref:VPS9 domain-containing protein n=1 Tax=Schistocephalus solidus TaxID=70667 RepID=A0A0X3NY37_SCHSO